MQRDKWRDAKEEKCSIVKKVYLRKKEDWPPFHVEYI